MRDELFKNRADRPFEFDAAVASVFDDMVSRSVPYYAAAQGILCDFLAKKLPPKSLVYDIGCSTGAFLLRLYSLRGDLELIGIDSSPAMIEVAQNRSAAFGADLKLILGDAMDARLWRPSGDGVSGVILNYTLQFINLDKREQFLRDICLRLADDGVLVLSEKLRFEDGELDSQIREIYEGYKSAQGYSQTEIAAKRRALENVLIPLTEQDNLKMLSNAGFKSIQTLFRWGNFASFVAFK